VQGQVRAIESVIPYILCMVCIALVVDRDDLGDLGWRGPYPPLYSLVGQGYMEILAGYELRSPT
jgi:hypothetical protein